MRSTLLQVGPVLLAALFLAALIRSGRIDRDRIGLKAPRGAWLPIFLAYAVYLAVVEIVSIRTGLLRQEVTPWHFDAATTALRICGIVVVTPFVEEVIFRGVLQWKLAERFAPAVTILAQAVVFAAFHGLTLAGSHTIAFDVAQLLFEGAVLGWARWRTGSLYPTMAMHGMGNTLAVAERLGLI